MIMEDQKIKIYICRNSIKEYYESKGYENVMVGKYITVDARDLPPSSHQKIFYTCDYCGEKFERVIYSNTRSKKCNQKDACSKCRILRTKETNISTYGVSSPMKVQEICLKSQHNKIENMGEFSSYSATYFEKGIPVSKAQKNISELISGFELNYVYKIYYLDMVKDNIVIEYDGKGHDLGVRMGRISESDFKEKERIKEEEILKKFRLLRIVDKKDKLKKEESIKNYNIKEQIENFMKSDELYKIITID